MFSRLVFRQILTKPVAQVFKTYSFENIVKMSTNIPKFEHLAISVPKEFVYHVELNRPDKLNALNKAFFIEIKNCFEALSDDEDCRVVILSAAGKHYTAGLDLNDATQNLMPIASLDKDAARKGKLLYPLIKLYQQSMSSLEVCKKPVITAIHGACIGAGVELIVASDIRYCTKDAYFQVKEVDIGMAADVGSLQRLPKVIGSDSLVRELCYTCRKLPAAEALSSGLVSRVFDNKEELIKGVTGLAEEIAKRSPVAVQTTKASLVYSRDHSVQDGLDHIGWLNQLMLQSEDLITATMGQLSKDPNVTFSKL